VFYSFWKATKVAVTSSVNAHLV